MRVFERYQEYTTRIEIEFKAVCPIPDPPRPYYGKVTIWYTSSYALDFNEVEAELLQRIAKEMSSVEDVADHALQTICDALGSNVRAVTVEIEIPRQPGHLAVLLSAYSQ